MAIEVTDANFKEEVLESELPVVVKFFAEWCGPCKVVGPILDSLVIENDGKIKIVAVNVDNNPEVSLEYGIRNIPAILFFKSGEVVDKQIGSATRAVFDSKIHDLL